MDPALWELLEEGSSEDEIAAIIRLRQPGVLPPGVRVITQYGEIVTVRMKRGTIPEIHEEAEVASFKAPGPPMGPDMELYDAETFADLDLNIRPTDERRSPSLEATGKNIVVGVIDWGLDINSPAFRNPDGSTRILALWDQRGHRRPDSPQPYGYGVVHNRETINQALASGDPYTALNYHPADSDAGKGTHGTLVASIAASNGLDNGPIGVAPEASIVFVHLTTWGGARSMGLGDSVTLLEAADFIFNIAGERPCAINISMGRTGDRHDGTTLVEQGFDAMLRAAPGRAICQSTGNYYNQRLHASGQLRPTEQQDLTWEISQSDVTPNQLEIWYTGRDQFEVEIRSPNEEVKERLKLGERVPLVLNGKTIGRAYHRAAEPNNLDNHIVIILSPQARIGTWHVMLIASDVVDGRFHAWIERDSACSGCQSHFCLEDADPTSTTGTICNGLRTIAVGAYNPHEPNQPLGTFSSMGPTRDGRLKPDLCAPGVDILGTRSAPRDSNGEVPLLTRMSGTSFAAPHVTGTIALMFEVARRPLRIEEVHNLLLASTRKVHFPEERPGRVGSGYLDIERAVEAAQKIESVSFESKATNRISEAEMRQEEQAIENVDSAECGCKHGLAVMKSEESEADLTMESIEDESEIVNLADQIITETGPTYASTDLLNEILDRAQQLSLIVPSAAQLFDAFAYPGRETLRRELEEIFELVAGPNVLLDSLQMGDLIVRRGEGGLGHLSIVADPELWNYRELGSSGLIPESYRPGQYVQVIESGIRPHRLTDRFARRVTDEAGRMPQDQLVLRMKIIYAPAWREEQPGEPETEDDQLAERSQYKYAPGFKFRCKNPKGKKVMIDLSQPPGPVLLNFWDPLCPHCVDELPALQKIHEDFFKKKGLFVVGVSAGDLHTTRYDGEVFLGMMDIIHQKGLTYCQLHDKDRNMFERFGVTVIPRTFLIDKRGIIRADSEDSRSFDQFRDLLKKFGLLP